MQKTITFILGTLIAAIAFAQPPADKGKPGRTYVHRQMEATSFFRLNDDGTYSFWFGVGGFDEFDEGTWESGENGLVLTSYGTRQTPSVKLTREDQVDSEAISVEFVRTRRSGEMQMSFEAFLVNDQGDLIPLQHNGGRFSGRLPRGELVKITLRPMNFLTHFMDVSVAVTNRRANSFTVHIENQNFGRMKFRGQHFVHTKDSIYFPLWTGSSMRYKLESKP